MYPGFLFNLSNTIVFYTKCGYFCMKCPASKILSQEPTFAGTGAYSYPIHHRKTGRALEKNFLHLTFKMLP